MKGNKPENRFSAGAMAASIFKNEITKKVDGKDEKVEFKTTTISRNYMDKEGKWQSTNSLRINDIPKAILVLQKAYDELVSKQPKEE